MHSKDVKLSELRELYIAKLHENSIGLSDVLKKHLRLRFGDAIKFWQLSYRIESELVYSNSFAHGHGMMHETYVHSTWHKACGCMMNWTGPSLQMYDELERA